MKEWLVYLYPRAWRERYGDEFRAVLAQQRLTIADVVDIMRGALDAQWTTVLARSQDPTTLPRLLSQVMPLVWLAVVISGCFFVAPVVFNPFGRWRFVARPPLPPQARHVDTEYPRALDYSYDDVNRTTTFETDQPVAAIQQFYRTALPRKGWHYLCTATPSDPSCGRISGGSLEAEVREVYDPSAHGTRHGHAIEIIVSPPAANGTRTVQVREVLLSPGNRVPYSTDPTGPPDVALVGLWRGIDNASGKNFMLWVYQDNRVEVSGIGARGAYRWDDDNALQLTFAARTARVVGEDGDGKYGLCTNAPAFLKPACYTALVPPVVYPGPSETSTPMPTTPVRVGPAATPASMPTPDSSAIVVVEPAYPGPPSPPTPTPEPREDVDSQIDATFAVTVNSDTLQLTNASGMTQIFRRVDGT